ncbi:hypothetical protein PIB30_080438 [Stylosanthes scabra]|uniref:Uncharacterized protein n=1 Tax=Stylosanthes scabra TaxID=79078 RepID=A0ABU6UQ80_9FABA|nr:hypothetical protein [Stylosanthes scabra]
MFEAERPIYPKAGEDLLDFLLRQREGEGNVAICPRCSALFDSSAAKAYVSYKKSKERMIQEREKQAMLLRNPVLRDNKQKVKGQKPPVRQQMRKVVMVDGKPQGFSSKTRVPPSNVSHNKWVQNNAPNYSRHSHVAGKPKGQADFSPRKNTKVPFIPRPVAQPEPFVEAREARLEGPYPELTSRESTEPRGDSKGEIMARSDRFSRKMAVSTMPNYA